MIIKYRISYLVTALHPFAQCPQLLYIVFILHVFNIRISVTIVQLNNTAPSTTNISVTVIP